jgi:hypothetical protein
MHQQGNAPLPQFHVCFRPRLGNFGLVALDPGSCRRGECTDL